MSDIIVDLEGLTPDELRKIASLANKFQNKNKTKKPVNKTRTKIQETDLVIERPVGRTAPRKRIIEDKNEKIDKPSMSGKGRASPRNPQNQQGQGVRRDGKKPKKFCRTESFTADPNRPNKFFTMGSRGRKLSDSEKNDTAIDKLLWKDRVPSERREMVEYVEVQCRRCNLWFDTHPDLIMNDPDRGLIFTCNDCAGAADDGDE